MRDGQYVVLALYEVHMASAALMIDGVVVAAAHEERFSRLKNDVGFPLLAARFCLEKAGIEPHEVDAVPMLNEYFDPNGLANVLFKRMAVYNQEDWIRENELFWGPKLIEKQDLLTYFHLMGGWDRVPEGHYYSLENLDMNAPSQVISETFNAVRRETVERLLGIPKDRIHFMPHYMCHHYHAYYSGTTRGNGVVIIHAEGDGGLYNQAVSKKSEKGLQIIAGTDQFNLGRLYQWTTLLLGMKPYHHEYKLMGLAPHASNHEIRRSMEVFEPVFKSDPDKLVILYQEKPADLYFTFRDRLQGQRFDGIAGALQQVVEDRMQEWVTYVVRKSGCRKVAFGGGVAMNVKANMLLWQLKEVDDLFVPLSPGDESNVFGAAYWLTEKQFLKTGRDPEDIPPLGEPYLGSSFSHEEIQKAIEEYDIASKYNIQSNIDKKSIALILANGHIVACCRGKSEFGQRALGNRSILANPSLDGVVEKINTQIKYRDFWMPFAPTILFDYQHEYIENPKNIASDFMTMAFPVKQKASEKIKGAIHPADNTARPQILKRNTNPDYYDLIDEFRKFTGIAAILNTSFNLHGEPIVNSPADAFHVFENSDLDCLWLGDFLISRVAL